MSHCVEVVAGRNIAIAVTTSNVSRLLMFLHNQATVAQPRLLSSFTDQMGSVLFVLAHGFQNLGVSHQVEANSDAEWLRVCLRIVYGEFDLHASIGQTKRLGSRESIGPKPCRVIEPSGCNDQSILFPMSHRVAEPACLDHGQHQLVSTTGSDRPSVNICR